MGSVNKSLALTVLFLVLSSLIVLSNSFSNVHAESPPSVPQFSIKLVDNSHDVSPYNTTTTDPYTGKETTTTYPSFRVEQYVIEVTIKNQPFTAYTNVDGYDCYLYYDVQVKPHFDENWRSSSSYYPFTNIGQASSKETIVTYTLSENDGFLVKPPSGGQLDFRVEAFTGYWRNPMPQEAALGFRDPIFVREELSSGWSSIQTITITYDSSSPSPSQTNPPTNPSTTSGNNQPQLPNQTQPPSFIFNPFFLLGIVTLLVCVIIVLVVLFLIRQTKTSPTPR